MEELDRTETIEAMNAPRGFLSAIKDDRSRNVRRRGLWRLGAPAFELIDISEDLSTASAAILLEMAAIHAEAGAHDEAISLSKTAVEKDRDILSKQRYMGLTWCLHLFAPDLTREFVSEMPLLEGFLKNQGMTAHLLADEGKSICIVGNSPSLLGMSRGKEIDSHDLVIRFNNFETLGYEKDYGRKIDIWVRGRQRTIWPWDAPKPVSMIVTGPSTFWRVRNGQYFAAHCALSGLPNDEVGTRTYYGAVKQVGAPPSSGLIMIWWLICLRGSLNGVTVVGFDPGSQVSGLKHYFQKPSRLRPVTHDWSAESEVLHSWLETFGDKAPGEGRTRQSNLKLNGVFDDTRGRKAAWQRIVASSNWMRRLFQPKP